MPEAERQSIPQAPRGRSQRQRIARPDLGKFLGEPRRVAPLPQRLDVEGEILLVSAERFVRALPVQQHGYAMLLGKLEYAPLCELAGTPDRQLVVPHELR